MSKTIYWATLSTCRTLNSFSSPNKCNICSIRISSLEQIFAHLASDHHLREEAELEKELESSWNSMRNLQGIPSLLGSWAKDIRK
jgi:hypothetical protein